MPGLELGILIVGCARIDLRIDMMAVVIERLLQGVDRGDDGLPSPKMSTELKSLGS